MFLSPYSTTPCKNHRMNDIDNAVINLVQYGHSTEFGFINIDSEDERSVYTLTSNNKTVKPFAHPIVLNVKNSPKPIVVIDGRGTSKLNVVTGDIVPTSNFNFAKMRAMLMSKAWLDGNVADLLNCGGFQVEVFALLMSENLTKRLNLDDLTRNRIACISAYYYLWLFKDLIVDDEDELLRMKTRVSRAVRLPLPDVIDILKDVPSMMTITDYTDALRVHSNSVRLEKMSPAFLYTALGGIWFGPNAVETVAVSLEHPPTFCAMVATAYNDYGFKKSILGLLVVKRDKLTKTGSEFTTNVLNIIR